MPHNKLFRVALSCAAALTVSTSSHATANSVLLPTSGIAQSALRQSLHPSDTSFAASSQFGVRAKWAFATFGDVPGGCGFAVQKIGGKTEVLTGGSLNASYDNYWYAFEYDPSTNEYVTTYSTPLIKNGVAKIAIADVLPRPGKELVVLDGNSRFLFYDAQDKGLLMTVTAAPMLVSCAALADFDGDGLDEIVECGFDRTRVLKADGTLVFEILGAGGYTIAVGQMDGDPSLEIATQNGAIIDYATQSVQTTLGYNTATGLCAVDLDGDGKDELITTEISNTCRVWDVATGTEKFHFPVADDGEVIVGDPLGNGSQQIVIAGRKLGSLRGYSATTGAPSWKIETGKDGATFALIADVNDDGKPEVVWGSGIASSAPDVLTVGDATTQSILWEGIRLIGPYIGPFIGDLDGDGNAELVAGANTEVSGGKLVVLDANTHRYRGTSPFTSSTSSKLASVALADLDGNGRQEMLAGCTGVNGAVIQVWRFDSNGQFTSTWENPVEAGGATFRSIDAADIDGTGDMEIVGGEQKLAGPPVTALIHAYDYASRAEIWNAPLPGISSTISCVRVIDLNGDGVAEIIAELDGSALWIFDGKSKALELKIPGSWTALRIRTDVGSGPPEIWVANKFGRLWVYRWNGTTYAFVGTHMVLPQGQSVEAFDFGRLGSVYIGAQGVLSFESTPDLASSLWSFSGYGIGTGRNVVELPMIHEIVTAGDFSIIGIRTYP